MTSTNFDTHEYRCTNCNKLLAKSEVADGLFEIKCHRCGTINALFSKMDDQVIITDQEGVILYANSSLLKTTGYTLGEVVGKTPKIWGGLMPKEFYEALWQKIKVEKQSISVIMTNRKKDGQIYNAKLQISPVCDTENNIRFFIGIETIIS